MLNVVRIPHATLQIGATTQMQEDRQREIAAENHSLMHRLAGIMKEERGGPAKEYAHLSVEYRGSLRRKKLLKLEVCFCWHVACFIYLSALLT